MIKMATTGVHLIIRTDIREMAISLVTGTKTTGGSNSGRNGNNCPNRNSRQSRVNNTGPRQLQGGASNRAPSEPLRI